MCPVLAKHSRVRDANHLPQPTGHTLVDTAQRVVSLHYCTDKLLIHVWFVFHQGCLSVLSVHQPALLHRVIPPRYETSAIALTKVCEGSVSSFLQLYRTHLSAQVLSPVTCCSR